LGGVANKTAESMLLCEAAGYDVILIETVGVGQSETAVHGMTDFFLLLMLAGAGDELQGIKKGIMEMADMVVINKADGDNIRKSELARLQYQNALHIFPLAESGWEPIVTKASSTKNTGIDTVWEEVLKYKQLVTTNGYFIKNRNQQKIRWMYDNINEALKQLFYGSKEIAEQLSVLEKNIISSEISPVKAAEDMIEKFKKTF
jgi:LAO/AO transport system kinase